MTPRRYRPSALAGAASTALIALLAAQPAVAQAPSPVGVPAEDQTPVQAEVESAADDTSAIIVTARRREENLLEVPVAITSVDSEGLVKANVVAPQDLGRVVPGLATGSGSTRGFSQLIVTIRGQRNGEPSIAADQSIGIYFAEVPQNASQGLNTGFFDLQSVQVLKGPQGTLFGRNATGGAVLIQPNRPEAELGGYFKAAVGSNDLRDFEGVFNFPVTETLAVRLATKFTERDGYLTNALTGQKFNSVDRRGARASVRWTPTDGFETTTIGTINRGRSVSEGWRLFKLSPLATPALRAALAEIQAAPKYTIFNNAGTPGFPIQNHTNRTRTWSIQNTTQVELSDAINIKNIIGYRDVFDLAVSLPSGSRVATQDSTIEDDLTEFSEELQIQGATGDLDFVAGLYYFQTRGNELITSFNNGLNRARKTDGQVKNTSYSAFAHIDYELDELVDGLSVSLGGRITHDKRLLIRRGRDQNAVNSPLFTCQLQPTIIGPDDRNMCNLPFRISFTRPTWEASLNWQMNDDQLFYGSYRRGYRTGGFSSSASNLTIAGAPYGPETVDVFELGSKSAFEGDNVSAQLTVAAFYNDYKDIQRRTNVLAGLNRTFNFTTNAARAHLYGGEAELHLELFKHFRIDAGYAYLQAKYDEWFDPVVIAGVVYQNDISGSRFNDVSKHQLNLGASYELPTPDDFGDLTISANYSYRSGFTTMNEINTPKCTVDGAPATAFYANCYNSAGVVPGYGIANARLAWDNLLDSGIDAAVFVNNLTNNYYSRAAITALSTLGFFATAIGEPRMFGIEVKVPFGGMRR